MRIGVSTSCFYPLPTEKAVELMGEMGIKRVEIFCNTFSEFSPEFADEIRRRMQCFGMDAVSVHPFFSALESMLFFSEYSGRTADSLDLYDNFFAMAAKLGAKYLTFHGNRLPERSKAPDPSESDLSAMDRLISRGASHGIIVAQENVSWCCAQDPDYIECLRRRFGKRIGFTLDIKQARRVSKPLEIYIDAMGDRLVNIHASDNTPDNSCMLPGRGDIDWRGLIEVLTRAGYDGDLLIEVYRDSYKDYREIAESYCFLLEILDKVQR